MKRYPYSPASSLKRYAAERDKEKRAMRTICMPPRREGDEMVCSTCGVRWDVDEDDPHERYGI